jgi:hypothetical protein
LASSILVGYRYPYYLYGGVVVRTYLVNFQPISVGDSDLYARSAKYQILLISIDARSTCQLLCVLSQVDEVANPPLFISTCQLLCVLSQVGEVANPPLFISTCQLLCVLSQVGEVANLLLILLLPVSSSV